MGIAKVAVIMPCYNAGKFLKPTIDSVLNQSFTGIHLLCGNDGSSDDTAQILAGYGDQITVLSHSDYGNHGQAATYNLCLNEIDTNYVAFVDSDDLWRPDKVLKQVELLDNNPAIGLVYTNGDIIDGHDRVLYSLLPDGHREMNQIGRILLNCYIRTPSSVMVRTSVLKAAGEFEVGIIPDHDMWIRLAELTRFAYLEEKLIGYRLHIGQVSQILGERMWQEGFDTLERAMQRYSYPHLLKWKRRAVLHYRLGTCSWQSNRLKALSHFLRALAYDPLRAISWGDLS